MIYVIENGKVCSAALENIEKNEHRHYWGVISFDEIEEIEQKFNIHINFISQSLNNTATRFESHDGFDYICLNVLNYSDVTLPFFRTYIYMCKDLLLFICDNTAIIEEIIKDLADDVIKSSSFERLFSVFFDRITSGDVTFLEDIEQELSELENALIETKKRDCVKEIISLRKKLMSLKRYYEQLINVLDEIQENENNIIDNKTIRYFKIFAGRVDRLYHSVLNLRDYVTQVREAYQAEVDISLNGIMKLFTVITAIFLPLTLIVGWYGMNLKMPEFHWDLGYPMVIGLTILVVVGCLVFFKKNKWF